MPIPDKSHAESVPPAARLRGPQARQLILKELGCVRLPVDEELRAALATYDVVLKRGCSLAFYEASSGGRSLIAVREFGGPEPRLTPLRAPTLVESRVHGPWRLVGTYSGKPLFTGTWENSVLGMPKDALAVVRTRRTEEGEVERTLFKRRGHLMLQTVRAAGHPEVEDLGKISRGTGLEVALAYRRKLLTFPVTAAVEIECDDPAVVAEEVRLIGDPSGNSFAGLWDDGDDEELDEDLEIALTRYEELSLIRITINGTIQLAGRIDSRWVLVPVDAEAYGGGPKLSREFASCSFGFDGGTPGMACGAAQYIGEVRPGLLAAWTYWDDDPSRCELTLGTGSPIEFTTREIVEWDLLPLVIDELIESRGGAQDLGDDLKDYEEVQTWIGLPDDRAFLSSLRNRLPYRSPLERRIWGWLQAGHPDAEIHDALLTVRVRPKTGDGVLSVLRAQTDGQLVLEHRDGFLEPERHYLGNAEPGCELPYALTARPDLLTVPANATVEITCADPDLAAERLTLTGDPAANTLDDLYDHENDDWLDEGLETLLVMFEQLKAARITINGTEHLAAEVDGRWRALPVTTDSHAPGLKTGRLIAEANFDFEGGGMINSGSDGDYVGEIRPGLNAAWNTSSESTGCYLALGTGDPIEFAAKAISDWPLMAIAIDNMIGSDIAEELSDQLDGYDGHASIDLDPTSAEGQHLLRALSSQLAADSPAKRSIDAYLASITNPYS